MTVSSALRACDRLAANDDDLPSLARAASSVSYLASFGSTRLLSALGDDVIEPLAQKNFDRAVLRVMSGCTGNDEAVATAKPALRGLDHLGALQAVPRQAGVARRGAGARGQLCREPLLLGPRVRPAHLAQALGEEDVATVVGLRLGSANEPLAAAGFLEGFLEVNALVLVKSRPVVEAPDTFLAMARADGDGRGKRIADDKPVLALAGAAVRVGDAHREVRASAAAGRSRDRVA